MNQTIAAPTRRTPRTASLLAFAVLVVALVNLVSVTPLPWIPHVMITPTHVGHGDGSRALLLSSIGLVFLAAQLNKAKRRAWQVATALAAVSALVQLGLHRHWPAAAVSGLVCLGLVACRRVFTVASEPVSASRVLRWAGIYLGAVFGYGLLVLWLLRGHLDTTPSAVGMVRTVAVGLVGVDGPYEIATGYLDSLFALSLLILGLVGAAVGAVLLFRPHVHRHRPDPAALARARSLVDRYGTDSLSYFALRDDKTHFFSSDGRAMISYAYRGGYALASGDPVGDAGSLDLVLDEFCAYCAERGWGVAFLAAREHDAERYTSRGLLSYYLGDEAVIDCQRFSLVGRPIRKVRQSCNRLTKAGYTFELVDGADATREMLAELADVSRKWRGTAPERGFTMSLGRLRRPDDDGCLLAVTRDAEGVLRGFLQMVPCGGDRPGYSLDLMRRDPGTPNGLMEFLVCETVAGLRERGAERFSLNFSAFARLLHDDTVLNWWQRVQRWIVRRCNPYFQIESLYDFNRKFFPDWEPRAIYYDARWNTPRIALLYVEVETLVNIPLLRRLVSPSPPTGAADVDLDPNVLPAPRL